MEENKNMMVEVDELGGMRAELLAVTNQYCSIKAVDGKAKAALFNAMNNPDKRLSDMINKQIAIRDLYMEMVQCAGDGGEILNLPRIVLIDDKGISYQCVSTGIFGCMKKLVAMYGEPTWKEPIKVSVLQKKTRRGYNVLTLAVEG